MREHPVPHTTLVATTASADDARRAVEALSLHGVDGGRIRVTDPARPRSSRGVDEDRATDRRVLKRLGSRLATGIGIGALAGAVVGAAVLGVVAATSVATLVGAAAGAVAGAGLGAAVGLQSTPSMATAWEDANAPGPGARRVVVTDVEEGERTELLVLLRRHARSVQVADGSAINDAPTTP